MQVVELFMDSASILTIPSHNECSSTFIGTTCRRTCFWQRSTTVSVPLPSSTFNDRHVKIWAELLEAQCLEAVECLDHGRDQCQIQYDAAQESPLADRTTDTPLLSKPGTRLMANTDSAPAPIFQVKSQAGVWRGWRKKLRFRFRTGTVRDRPAG